MLEIGADIKQISRFIDVIGYEGLQAALCIDEIPQSARQFMAFTTEIINSNQPYQLSAFLAYGQEALVPQIFRSLIEGLMIKPAEAPGLYGYLECHIQLDGQEYGPVATLMVHELW